MARTIKIDPVTRIEGHLKVEVTVETLNGTQQVIDAKCSGTMFRGFEKILVGRDPLDATHLTQRICGVCPVSHGMASTKTLEDAYNVSPVANGRILRNLVLGSNFIQSHVLHFYHLAALDYIDTRGILECAPWASRYVTDDMVAGDAAATLVNHYVQALEIRRKAHQMGAIFGGKLPCCATFLPGGCTDKATASKISAFRSLLSEIRAFVDNVFIPDIQAVASLFPNYYEIGQGCGNLLAYGVFELDNSGSNKLLARGRYTNGTLAGVNTTSISEDVAHSWYSGPDGLNPTAGLTNPDAYKTDAYSWIKAPRYSGTVHEVGPLARMWVNGDYRNGISALDRLAARAFETKKVADAMDGWLDELAAGQPTYQPPAKATSGTGNGLTEAPRGALGHWLEITPQSVTHEGATYQVGRISRYQIVTPTGWNASPKDAQGQPGAMEQALMGTPVADPDRPIEVLRVIHSFDPCLACSVHMMRPGKKAQTVIPAGGGF